ncbi:MAG: helix-turn-helix domain-containing protein [Isosphaeraceae bacterium]
MRRSDSSATIRRAGLSAQVCQMFATCLCAFRECSDEVQSMIVEMASIANDPEAAPDERDAAVATIAEALFLDVEGGPLGFDLEDPGASEVLEPEARAAAEVLDAEEATFSERLAVLLRDRQVSQIQLAESIGVGQPAISMMLSRGCRPQRRTVAKIAAALGVAPEVLWPGFNPSET